MNEHIDILLLALVVGALTFLGMGFLFTRFWYLGLFLVLIGPYIVSTRKDK
jgi:hypothetical protein